VICIFFCHALLVSKDFNHCRRNQVRSSQRCCAEQHDGLGLHFYGPSSIVKRSDPTVVSVVRFSATAVSGFGLSETSWHPHPHSTDPSTLLSNPKFFLHDPNDSIALRFSQHLGIILCSSRFRCFTLNMSHHTTTCTMLKIWALEQYASLCTLMAFLGILLSHTTSDTLTHRHSS
jgi:hypothetical protein